MTDKTAKMLHFEMARKNEIKMFIRAHKNEYKKELIQIKSNKKTFIKNNINNEENNGNEI